MRLGVTTRVRCLYLFFFFKQKTAFESANVAGESVDRAVDGEFGLCLLENIFAAAADIDGGAEFEEACGHGFAEAGSATGNEDALGMEKIVTKHACSGSDEMTANAGSSPGLRPLRMTNDKLYLVRHAEACRLLNIASDAEAVVCVVEVWRNAGTGGAAGDFDVMAP